MGEQFELSLHTRQQNWTYRHVFCKKNLLVITSILCAYNIWYIFLDFPNELHMLISHIINTQMV